MNLRHETASPADTAVIEEWRSLIAPSCDTLGLLAGATEDEFLQIGSRLQDFYLRSSEITAMANQMVESGSGERALALIGRLRRMMGDMEAYVACARNQSRDNCRALERILELLGQASEPLEGFQKMTKALRMLGISTKIESSRLGDMGTGFLTLAMDVEKLSLMVSEKSADILRHRQVLASMITDNLRLVRNRESAQDAELGGVLDGTSRSLDVLIAVNARCGSSGALISSISGEVSGNIGEVVASMQMHDMTRQQVEHIVEALRRLVMDMEHAAAGGDDETLKKLVIEAGDVCELQAAQLRYATNTLCNAIESIIDNLRDVAGKQSAMAAETLSTTGSADSADGSFMDTMGRGLAVVTGVLASCARSNGDMVATLRRVGETMREMTGFVTDIEDIGSEIDLIALNSQIKAAHTGKEGAALGVLAEAIKRLSVDAVNQTATVSEILRQTNASTAHLFDEATQETEQQGGRITAMEDELGTILTELEKMNANLAATLNRLGERVGQLTDDIERTTGGIDVHTRVRRMSEEVENALDRVVGKARELEPASTEFKENLRHMEQCYTMESERRIHDSIALKRNVQVSEPPAVAGAVLEAALGGESEFGDNVDLF
jgi:hypothetical protein